MLKTLNENLTGLRGLILAVLSTVVVVADQLRPIADQLLSGDVTPVIILSSITAIKLIFTDVRKKFFS